MENFFDWCFEHSFIFFIGGILLLIVITGLVIYQDSKLPRHPVPYCQSYEGMEDRRCNGYYSTHPSVDAGFVQEIVR